MAALIDTSVFVESERSGYDPATVMGRLGVAADEPVALAAITAAELYRGVELGDLAYRTERLRVINDLLARFAVLPLGVAEARVFLRINDHLKRIGQSIAAPDLLIAATALARGWSVATHNRRHFDRIPDLVVLGPPAR